MKSGNNSRRLSDNIALKALWLLNSSTVARTFSGMKHSMFLPALMALLLALPATAQAACIAEFKAKQDNPLRLQHGEMQVASCDVSAATAEVRERLAQQGWILLKIVSLKG